MESIFSTKARCPTVGGFILPNVTTAVSVVASEKDFLVTCAGLRTISSLGLPDAVVEIQDLAGDGNHYSATVTSSQFSGKSKIEQHKMVYNSLKGKMGNELHALAIKTKE